MAFLDYLKSPSSKKITLVEIDVPISVIWINYSPAVWFTTLTPGDQGTVDDHGVSGYWDGENTNYYNINSLNVSGTLYTEVSSIALCQATQQAWYYDSSTTKIYVHFENDNPPEYYQIIAPGAVAGFSNQVDTTTNNYYENIYYEPLITAIPNLSKRKDPLFFGLIQYQGGTISMDNTGGYFDTFAQNDIYGQPVRIKLTFEGLAYSEALLVYTGKMDTISHDFIKANINLIDGRKQLSRKLPINTLTTTDTASAFYFPSMDTKLDGTPVPLPFGSIIKAPAYRTSAGNWIFADTTYNSIASGIIVYDKDGVVYAHGGTETDGTFTATDTTGQLYVTYTQSTVKNGLDIISHLLATYENIAFTSTNYDLVEWAAAKATIKDEGIWIGKGNLKTATDIIQQVCIDNQGIFDVLADGRFTFRKYDPDRTPEYEIFQDELIDDPSIDYPSDEFLSSAKVEFSKDWLTKEYQVFTNLDYQAEVFGRYRRYKEQEFTTALTSQTDANDLAVSVLELSKRIMPHITLRTKTQNIPVRIVDNIFYTYKRQSGNIFERSRYQVLGATLNLTSYELDFEIRQIEEDATTYIILDGGSSTTAYDFIEAGDTTTDYSNIIDGGAA